MDTGARTRPAAVHVAALWFLLQFATPRLMWRLPPAAAVGATVAVWAASAALYALVVLRPARLPRWLVRGPAVTVAFLVAVLAFSLVAYPIVDDRRSTGVGSDADDAVLVAVDRMLGGDDPYGADTYLGNPPTAGPGSLLWFVPWSSRSTYPLGNVVAVAATFGLLWWRRRSWADCAVVALLVASSPAFWEGLGQGSDHVPFACGLAWAAIGLGGSRPVRRGAAAAWAVVVGFLSTVRAAFFYVPALAGAVLWRTRRGTAGVVGVAGTAVVVALHAAFVAAWGWDGYDPVQQLLVKRDEDLSTAGQLVVLAGAVVGAALVLRELLRRPGPPRLDAALLAGVAGPMIGIAAGSLVTTGDLGEWTGANYALETVVLAAVWAAGLAASGRREASA